MPVIVHKYGVLPPTNWTDAFEDEMRRMNTFWNKLVEIDRASRAAYFELMQEDPAVGALSAEIETVKQRLESLGAEEKRRRVAARSKKIDVSDLKDERVQLRARMTDLIAQAADARSVAREKLAPKLTALEADRRQATKTARQTSGLYWSNYNAVEASYETARKKAIRDGGELRFRRYTGEGRLVAQIQGGMTTDDLFKCTDSQLQIVKPQDGAWDHPSCGERRRRSRTSLRMVVFTRDRKAHQAHWPMIMHRPLPEGAIIKQATVTRRRIADRYQWSLTLMLRTPDVDPDTISTGANSCGLNLGWRRLTNRSGDGEGLRIATIASSRNEIRTVVLPEDLIEYGRYADEIQQDRDQRVNEAVARLRTLDWTKAPADPATPHGEAFAAAISALRTAPRPTARTLERLRHTWNAAAPAWSAAALDELSGALDEDRRDWREEAGIRRRLSLWRREIYRVAARDICRDNGLIVFNDANWHELAMRESPEGEENPTIKASRWYRKTAAVSEFEQALRLMAPKFGARIATYEDKTTWVCHACGHEVEDRQPARLIQTCGHCNASWDQDANAAKNLLKAATSDRIVIAPDAASEQAKAPSRYARTKRPANDQPAHTQ